MPEEKEGETPVAVETPAPSVDVEALLKEKTRLETELAQTQKGLKTAHQTLTEKDRELKHRLDLEAEITDLKELIAGGFQARDAETPAPLTELITGINKRREQRETSRRAEEAEETRRNYNQRADAVWTRTLAAYPQDTDTQEDIKELLSNGLIGMAERQVAKAEKVVKPPVKVPGVDHQKEVEEAARKMLEEQGQLSKNVSSPSGGGNGKIWTTSEIANMPVTQFLKIFPGGMGEVLERKLQGTVIEK